jgi:hypothetical protein
MYIFYGSGQEIIDGYFMGTLLDISFKEFLYLGYVAFVLDLQLAILHNHLKKDVFPVGYWLAVYDLVGHKGIFVEHWTDLVLVEIYFSLVKGNEKVFVELILHIE